MQPMQAWSNIQTSSRGVLDRSPSLHTIMILANSMILEERGRQAWSWRSPSPLGPGGAPASPSQCSQPAPSLPYLNALEEAWTGEQELSATSHSIGMQETVGNLVLLIDSFNKGEPNSLQLSNAHVRDRACRDKLAKEKRAEQEDPGKACSTTACKQEGQCRTADLSSQQKLEQRSKNNSLGHNNNNSLGTGNNSLGTGE